MPNKVTDPTILAQLNGGSAPARSGVFSLPPDPQQQAADARASAASAREAERLRMEEQRFAQQTREWQATHNPDGTKKDDSQPIGISPELMHLTGPEFLAKLSPSDQAQVKALAEGRMAFPTGKAASSPYWQQRLAEVSQYDPEFDAINYNARAQTRRDFTSGKSAQNIKALNTAIGHVGQLAGQIGGTASHGGLPGATLLNRAENALTRSSGSSGITNYTQTAGAVAGELTQVFRGTGGAEADIQRYLSELDPNASAEQKKAAVANILTLLRSRLDALNDQYTKGMGTAAGGLDVLDPHSKKTLSTYLPGFGGGSGPDGFDKNGGGFDTGGSDPTLAPGGASSKAIPVPDSMQQAHAAYLAAHRGNLDPNAYASFRAEMDRQNGFPVTPAKLEEYRKFATEANKPGAKIDPIIPPVSAPMSGFDQVKAYGLNNPGGAALLGAASLGGGMDEVAGGVNTLVHGGDLSTNIANVNAARQSVASAYPLSTIAGDIGGSLGMGALAGGAFPALGQLARSAPVLTGAAYGAASGALEDNDNRLGGFIGGGVTGLAGGAAGKYLAAPVLERAARSRVGQAFAAATDVLRNKAADAAPAPIQSLVRGKPYVRAPSLDSTESIALGLHPNFDQIAGNLRDAARLNLPYALADADPKLRMLAGAVTRKSPDARTLAEQTFDPRALGQADRAVAAIDTHLAPITDIDQRGHDLLAAGDIAAGPSYSAAKSTESPVPPGMSMVMPQPARLDPQLAAMLDTKPGREALNRARTIAETRGGNPDTLGLRLDGQGNTILAGGPSLDTLQLVKRGLDSHVEDFRDPITRQLDLRGNPLAQAINNLRGRYVARLSELYPQYAEGNAIWKGFADQKDALDLGYGTLPSTSTPRRQFDTAVAGLSDRTLPEAQMGYATSMADQVAKQRLSTNPYNTVYGSPLQQSKVATLFPEGAPNFKRTYDLEGDMAKTRAETLGGSPTAARLQADDALGEQLGTAAIDLGSQALTGGGVPLGSLLAGARRFVADGAKLGVGKRAEQKAAQIAPTLFDTSNPNAIADMVDQMAAKYSAIQARKADYARRSGLFGSVAGLAAFGP